MEPTFFSAAAEFRAWLDGHHTTAPELWVGFHKKSSGKPSITWPEAVDEALCFGWIDGLRRSVDALRYTVRFSPRKPSSTWSAVNIARVRELLRLGRMQAAGLTAFERRGEDSRATEAYEQRQTARLGPAEERQFRANQEAWEFFQSQPAWYRRIAAFWVVSGKKAETRAKRLEKLIEDSAEGRTIPPLTRKARAARS